MSEYCVYIILCQNDLLYTGITNNLSRRIKAHIQKTAARFTKIHKPQKLLACWGVSGGRSEALKVENYIKTKTRVQKKNYIQDLHLLNLNCEKKLSITLLRFAEGEIEKVNTTLFS